LTVGQGDRVNDRRWRVAGKFLWARVCRIWPVYALVTTLFGAYLVFKLVRLADAAPAYQNVQPSLTLSSWLQQLAMVQIWMRPWHDGASFVGPAWSISAEWLAYVLFPVAALLLYRLRRLPRWLLATFAVLLMLPESVLCLRTGSPYFPFSWAARILTGFTAGVLIYLVVRDIPRTDRVRRVASWLGWLLVAAVVGGLWFGAWLGVAPEGTERGGVGSRQLERRLRRVGRRDIGVGALQRQRDRDATGTGPKVEHARTVQAFQRLQRCLDQAFRFGPGNQHGAVDTKAAPEELALAQKIRNRFAGQALGAQITEAGASACGDLAPWLRNQRFTRCIQHESQ